MAERHELRLAATEALWRERSMLPEHTEEIVDVVLDAVLAPVEHDDLEKLARKASLLRASAAAAKSAAEDVMRQADELEALISRATTGTGGDR